MQVEGVMGGPHLEEQVTFGKDKSPSGIHEIKDKDVIIRTAGNRMYK